MCTDKVNYWQYNRIAIPKTLIVSLNAESGVNFVLNACRSSFITDRQLLVES